MTPPTPPGVRLRPCRVCAARPALMYEQVCFECFETKEAEREVVRLGRELASALRRIEVLEEKATKVVSRRALKRENVLARQRFYNTRWRRLHREERRAYNREWMRAYRARQRAVLHEEAA